VRDSGRALAAVWRMAGRVVPAVAKIRPAIIDLPRGRIEISRYKDGAANIWIAEGDASACARLSAEEVLQLIGSLCPAPKRRKPSGPRLSRRKINEAA
jgi:hypothetical protein